MAALARIPLVARVFSGRILSGRLLASSFSSSSLLSIAGQKSPRSCSSRRIGFARSRNMSSSKVGNGRAQAAAVLTKDAVATVGLTKAAEQALPEVEVAVSGADPVNWSGDLLVVGVFEGGLSDEQGPVKQLDAHLGGILGEIASEEDFSGKSGQSSFIRLPGQPFKRIGLVGLGKVESTPSLNSWRKIGDSIAAAAKTAQASYVAVLLSTLDQSESPSKVDAVAALASGVLLGTFEDARFKSEQKKPTLKKLEFLGVSSLPSLDDRLQVLVKVCAGVVRSRQLVNAPANVLTPSVLAEEALKIASEHSEVFAASILDEDQCKELKMGAYLGVAVASANPPKFIHLQYRPSSGDVKTKLAIVGKGLTFDSGGYNLKPSGSSIELMKFDMGGAAAALGAAKALGAIQPAGVEVHFIVAACENMISGAGMRPGDILTASNGKTIEVNNTDAEGRLTLADALIYACNQKVDKIVDLATLTGACVVALGNEVAGMFTPSDELAEELSSASNKVGEKLWRMPLEEAYWDMMKSGIADMLNTGGRPGGSITAALFLKQFVDEKIPWAHLDIAGPVWNEKKKGATGFAVATLVEWVLKHSVVKG